MFSQYFGNYLLEKGKITEEQFSSCMDYMKANRVKLGLIAEAEGLLTRAQANELNRLQMQTDKRFGDLAVEKGYLTEGDITNLLHMQGNPYLIFVQALEESQLLSREEIDSLLDEYQKESRLANTDIAALKVGNLDELINFFVPTGNEMASGLYGLALRNIIRFISSYIRFEGLTKVTNYSAKNVAYQCTEGAFDGFIAMASQKDEILSIADGYAGEFFDSVNEDALDAVSEFINCINGLYATELSYRGTSIDMIPPQYGHDINLASDTEFYVLPLYILRKRVDLIIGVECKLQ